ncbi:NUDIX hydrolase [Mucilaginibacter xinganensis]|uniref:NUDIX hydrolase n=1 Tax=Mucilaginibacter xinganensis TaxID=1234841 RepID=A0A223NVU4_9SPHI|nr:NUDIX domain-containing protein [Mucilaginibacter xinganensis]ASU33992.1 NUDIX hydrolase [Mucilaginibacter xinganensis]
MAQKYRIYINDKVLLLTESLPKNIENYKQIDAEAFDMKILYTWIVKQKSKLFYVLCADAKLFLKTIVKSVVLVRAAGGLVKNENNAFLFIYRNNKWDLPKGKIEKREGTKEAAVREVEEECGIKVSKLDDRICKTYHSYIFKGELVLKKTYWFNMRCKGQNNLKPQKEEGITDVRWFKKDDIGPIIANTYPLIMDVLVKEKLIETVKQKKKKELDA